MKSFLLWVVLLTGTHIISQNTLEGAVKDADSNPLAATIHIPQLEIGTITDLDGKYTIGNIPDGTYKVVITALGYATLSQDLNFPGDSEVILNAELEGSAVEIQEIILSIPFHNLQSENVMRVERISADDIRSRGAITLADGITNISGVESITTGVGIGKPVIRGLSANRVLTYTQGVRLENQQFGDEHGLGVNLAGIESVEVIKGPASLLYGSDALGGVLYINPEAFAPIGKFAADAGGSYFTNTQGIASTIGGKYSGERFKFLVRGAYVSHSDYETGDGSRVTNTRFNETDIKTGLRYQTSKVKSTLRYNYNRANIGIPEEIGVQSTSRDLLFPFQEIDNHVLSWENNLYFSNSSLDIKLGYLFNDRREFEDEEDEGDLILGSAAASADEAALRLKLNTYNYDVKYNLPRFGKFETIVGVQGMYQKNENFGEEILIPDATKFDFGILATTHYHQDDWSLQAGLRLDTRNIDSESARTPGEFDYIPAVDRNFTSFNAALGAKYDISEFLIARLNFATGFRAPNLAELASNGVHVGTNRYEIGNPNLTNEQNFQTDLSLEFGNEHFEFFVNGFYNTIADYIFISPTGEMVDDNFVFDYIQTDANLFGGEAGFHLHPHPLDWLHLESSFETVTGEISDGGNLPLIPANTIKNTFRVEFNEIGQMKNNYAYIGLNTTLDQEDVSFFETRTGGYSLFNAGVGTSIQLDRVNLELGIQATNLFDKEYIAHLSRLKVDGVPNIGRNIALNLKLAL